MKPRARRSVSWILHSSSSVTESLYVERKGGGAVGSAIGIVWSTPGRGGGTYPEGMPRRTSLYDSRVVEMRALSDGDVQPENLRSARAEVKRSLRSASVSSVGGWTGKPSAVRGMTSVRDQGEGVAVESGVGSVVRPCKL